MTQKKNMKTIVFQKKPPRSAFFVGIPQELEAKEADEYIKLGFAIDPKAEKAAKEKADKSK